jgi:starvation-inducible DNA-binding protein
MDIEIGIPAKARKTVADALTRLLADTSFLYLQTHNYHWNVTGPMFQALHVLFETQYNELWLAVDEIAERIRALGQPAPGSYRAFAALTSLKEEDGVPNAKEMLRKLTKGHEQVVKTVRTALPLAENAGDEATLDLLITRLRAHEKAAWMLRSHLQ